MKRKSLSQVKNLMRRALVDVTDPLPSRTEETALRAYFQDRCAYCDDPAPRRHGHIDHAIHHGGNHLGNLILACPRCNGDEKREMAWHDFLKQKCGADHATLDERQRRILSWMERHPKPIKNTTPELDEALRSAEKAIEAFATAYGRVRAACCPSAGQQNRVQTTV